MQGWNRPNLRQEIGPSSVFLLHSVPFHAWYVWWPCHNLLSIQTCVVSLKEVCIGCFAPRWNVGWIFLKYHFTEITISTICTTDSYLAERISWLTMYYVLWSPVSSSCIMTVSLYSVIFVYIDSTKRLHVIDTCIKFPMVFNEISGETFWYELPREVSKLQDWMSKPAYYFGIWQLSWQRCCRVAWNTS